MPYLTFRTNWSGLSMRQSATQIDDYADTAGARRKSSLDTLREGMLRARTSVSGPGAQSRPGSPHHRQTATSSMPK
ncbi:hypothetical protein [Streptomyces sp. NPDC050287]|uniref:hypothetical protein n=1 Tax=Streptomyces sp. NPDC050287 TaxID=3365608 RepID=UPI00378803BA